MGIDAQWEQMEDWRGRFEVATRRMTSAVETQGSSKASRELRGSNAEDMQGNAGE